MPVSALRFFFGGSVYVFLHDVLKFLHILQLALCVSGLDILFPLRRNFGIVDFAHAVFAAFGLQWLRKAILRYSGYKDLHDETGIYARETAAAQAAAAGGRGWVTDWYGFTLSFKGVLLEGLEVVFIAITFGSSQRDVGTAALAAVAAAVVVAVAGLAVRAPLARVPENTLKFAVGVMLTSFGIFWGTEGAGASWPGNDAALLVVVPAVAAAAGLAAIMLRRLRRASTAPASPAQTAPAGEAAR